MLTGIHLRRYGDDLGDRGDGGLPRLLVELRAIRGVDRVRLSSIGAGALSDSFLRLFQEDPGLCPFFHIPLQSGSEAVLARMRRGYAVDDFLGTLERVRQALPHAVIATDLMVGFPGETEEEFEESLELCRRARFAAIHLFPYSLRPGTRAARLPGHLPPELKQARMERARSLAAGLAAEERERWIGRPVRVLVEEHRAGSAAGLSREGLRTRLAAPGAASLWNQEISARVTAADGEGLIARREDRHV
ncbi:MAG: radical SAM protein [Planctomycetota bacterium]